MPVQLKAGWLRARVAIHQASEIAMAGAVKKTIAQEVAEARISVEEDLYKTYIVDEFSVERIKRRVRESLGSNNSSGKVRLVMHHELAYLLGLQGRYQESMENLDLSEAWGLDPIAKVFSAAHISILNGQMLSAREFVEGQDFIAQVQPESKSLLASIHVNLGVMEKALIATAPNKSEFKHVQAATRILESIGVSDLELTKRLDTACRVIRESVSHPILGYKVFAMEGEGILYRFLVRASIDDVVELNDKVLDALIDNHDGPLDRELSIRVTPWTPDDKPDREEAYYVGIA